MTRALLQQALDALNERDIERQRLLTDAIRAELAKPEQEPHHDDVAVVRFADAMEAKMAKQRAKGYGGWDNKYDCSDTYLQGMLADHIAKGDPVDVGNFAMMLFNRGERTAQPAQEPDMKDAYVGAREDLAIWKRRALEAEELNRKFIAEINGPTFMGEPAAQPAQDPVNMVLYCPACDYEMSYPVTHAPNVGIGGKA